MRCLSRMSLPFLTPLFSVDLRAHQIPAPWAFGLADRVRFGELDILNHVNNAAYLRWFENFRIAYFQDYGMGDYRGTPPRIVLKEISLTFHHEVRLGDDYILTGRTFEVRRTSFVMEYGVWVRGQLCTTGGAVIVHLATDPQTGQHHKTPLPQAVKQAFITRDGAVQL